MTLTERIKALQGTQWAITNAEEHSARDGGLFSFLLEIQRGDVKTSITLQIPHGQLDNVDSITSTLAILLNTETVLHDSVWRFRVAQFIRHQPNVNAPEDALQARLRGDD